MTLLQVMPEDAPGTVLLRTRDEAAIADALAARGVRLRHWPTRGPVTEGTTGDDVLARYRAEVDALCAAEALRLVDVAQLLPEDTEEWRKRAADARGAFLEEHRHAENEIRFFAHGTGCFYLHLDDRVYAVVCEAGDLLSVPAGTRHWFDMGPVPEFCAIRFFEEEDGWVGDFTGDPIAGRFPRLDDLLAAAG
ncbi:MULTISPECIES: 1,2-dihydroxy-3-keto-5-methylthiopentene dioxygenase [Streptomycetaceae]|uniref:Acireductone dioxygenase n=1 Tax=Streptantibioticus cattleyicolor (strain ATCC 35852 / DSM 46488 / JCM 4925 / NBRC 14057 / NRRL 8057) TaxID=1003195 RepID=F8JUK3_STREN|nr:MULTISPECIES: cupin [Streptomycetaceae]AEW95629.1 putative oxidoreductase [Streptantibioticus cattleyicolor NRRL 8057 = DSM 46488]MYS60174.1 cupin [Streptomyces sp. SID5468]CCB75964.1 Acireductone dioxygenase 1 [Streptantibioticus cattleyicolor NRRL 8057 = DSM 46488]